VQGRCKQHGIVDGIEDRRGRLRCSVNGCRKLLAVRASSASPPVVSEALSAEAVPPTELAQDPDILQHRKALALANYRQAIRRALEPTELEKGLAALEKQMAALNERVDRMGERLDEVFGKFKALRDELDADPASNLGTEFTCEGCGASGLVAVRIRCTRCGVEDWWGYHSE